MDHCPLCGAQIDETDRFCRSCGTTLQAGSPAASSTPASRTGLPVWAVVAIAAVCAVAATVAVALVAGRGSDSVDRGGNDYGAFGAQQALARESAVIEGIHSLQVGIQSYAVDNNDVYPQSADQETLGMLIDNWPANPYTGAPMAEGTGPGDYSYERVAEGTFYTFTLTGFGENGPVITVP